MRRGGPELLLPLAAARPSAAAPGFASERKPQTQLYAAIVGRVAAAGAAEASAASKTGVDRGNQELIRFAAHGST
jgi:hypothetical protein